MAKKRKSGLLLPWSYSKLTAWEQCPLKARLQYIDKIPQPPSAAMDAGSAIHKALEKYVTSDLSLAQVHKVFDSVGKVFSVDAEKEVKKIRGAYRRHVDNSVEGKWGLALHELADNPPVLERLSDWFEAATWLRVVADVVLHTKTTITIYDYKTGKEYPDHLDQGMLYAWAALSAFPLYKKCVVKFIYVETGNVAEWTYSRALLKAAPKKWLPRVEKMNADTAYKATPNRFCNWCAYRKYCPENGGRCPAWKGGYE